jgi:ketosteroid isomerase-like protein
MRSAARRLAARRTSRVVGGERLALSLAAGAGSAIATRALLARLLLVKLRRDVRALSAGDYRPILSNYAQHAVLYFNDGEHRWAGEHRGRAAIERFLQDFVAAGIEGEISELLFAGPPWRMTLLARFDDHARDPAAGGEIYRNRTVLLARTRWGRIVRQEDFYEDSARIEGLERRLIELGVPPAG